MCLIIKFSLAAPVEKIARRISEALPRSPESSGRRPEARGDLGSAFYQTFPFVFYSRKFPFVFYKGKFPFVFYKGKFPCVFYKGSVGKAEI